ncbi:MAG TPA: adenylate/guanylate cyclase domain-containing protein [Nitrososphaeraceae archaeon]|nr:adenylate/guanylate cyclase domain-containing protein [Nitrososphaeraceae archaeon]
MQTRENKEQDINQKNLSKEKNDKRTGDSQANTDSLIDMMMDDDHHHHRSKNNDIVNQHEEIVDTETLVSQTQDRIWRALKRRYQYDSTLKTSRDFLLNHVNSKICLVVLYADLVGSTNMSMTLPVDKFTTIIRAFSYEMSSIVHTLGGYVLKFVGDAVIAFFPSDFNKLLACDKATQCAKSMIAVIKNGINPILNQYDYPELSVKIGLDEGENVIVQYGHDKISPIDILGYCMSISAKITSLTDPNKITIGEDVYNMLHPQLKMQFKEVKYNVENWKYANRHTGQIYKLYTIRV